MKNTGWLGVALCAALVACTATPPRETPPASAATAVEPQRAAVANSAVPMPSAASINPAPPLPGAPATPAAASATAIAAAAPDAKVAAVPAEKLPVASTKPVATAVAKPAPRPAASPKPAAVTATAASVKPAAAPGARAVAPVAAARSLTGRMELVASARQAVAAGEAAEGVVYFLPKAGSAKPKPDRFNVDTHSKGFLPGSLVVPVGSTVAFPNRDEILHNVYSATPGTTFDLGTYGPGQTRSARFGKAGLVVVACNVHHGMRSNVLVLETPYYTRPGRDGRFELKNLPSGPGTLVFWHPRTVAQSRAITAAAAPVTARLTAVRARVGAN